MYSCSLGLALPLTVEDQKYNSGRKWLIIVSTWRIYLYKKSFSALSTAFIDKSLSDNFLEEAIIKLVKTRVTYVDETNQEC